MKRLDRYILTSFVGPFIAILLIVVFILMMQFLWLYIDELVGKGLGIKVILEFLGWGCATLLPLSLPLATLLSSMMTMGSLGENNELLAIKAAGVSLARILRPLIITSAAIAVGTFFVTNNLVPVAYNNIYTLRDDIAQTKQEIKIPDGTFYDGIDGYVMRVETTDKETGMMHGMMVYSHAGKRGNISLTIADSGLMQMSDSKNYLKFTLFHGNNYEETNTRKYRDTTLKLQKIAFDKQELLIPLENYAFEKSDTNRFADEVKSMKLSLLVAQKDSLDWIQDSSKVDHLNGLVKGRPFRYNNQLDTSDVASRRTALFTSEENGKWKSLEEELEAVRMAQNNINDYISTLISYSRDIYRYQYVSRRTDYGILSKFATALACFIMFFIGAPIGALTRKGGLGVPAIISVLLFVLYWVINITGERLSNTGTLPATFGAFIASFVLAILGGLLTWKSINDSSLFNMDTIKTAIKKFKQQILGTVKKTRIVYMGTPDFAVEPLKALLDKGYNVVGVVTVADKQSGRGLKVSESAVKKFALERGLPVLQPDRLKDPGFLEVLKAWKPDLFVVVAFRMLPKVVWEIPRLGTFNLHAALLPQYRGAAPINWSVINGDNMTGVTTFMINEGIDLGHIIYREQSRIEKTDTAGDVHDKLMYLGSDLVVMTVQAIIDGTIELRPQKSFIQGSEMLRPAPKLTRELCHIDWNDNTRSIYNLIRGLSPYPTAFTELVKDGTPSQLKVFFGEALEGEGLKAALTASGLDALPAPGTVLSDGKNFLAITTRDGAISIKDLQLAGKKRMDAKAFLLGFRDPMSYSTAPGSSRAVLDSVKEVNGQ